MMKAPWWCLEHARISWNWSQQWRCLLFKREEYLEADQVAVREQRLDADDASSCKAEGSFRLRMHPR